MHFPIFQKNKHIKKRKWISERFKNWIIS